MDDIRYTLRLNKILYRKFQHIADDNFRTVNKELEKLITSHIAAYEKDHGEIKLSDEH
ncbi:TraY domain-containing protein|uniref:Arc-like DNA binding domain-containing protein n=1 Tax=Dendrosporobacter quercicolus TaxID=146817 RepID=A0A1G9Q6P8_9FIRM|nr:TraY domain-containing protein [Dendrosporobacter quercicolus]NSL48130.1 TraY domain-containing protein [Dendrosporobacter quercicolus DSM 1736]SDM06421.1 hypothetical protein SAMN04488502_10255 [Dendrosporobacter quercicolus]